MNELLFGAGRAATVSARAAASARSMRFSSSPCAVTPRRHAASHRRPVPPRPPLRALNPFPLHTSSHFSRPPHPPHRRPNAQGGAVHKPLAVLPGADREFAVSPGRLRALPPDQADGGAARRARGQLQDGHGGQRLGCAAGWGDGVRGGRGVGVGCRGAEWLVGGWEEGVRSGQQTGWVRRNAWVGGWVGAGGGGASTMQNTTKHFTGPSPPQAPVHHRPQSTRSPALTSNQHDLPLPPRPRNPRLPAAEPSHTDETLSTLRFASRVRTLTTDLAVNESNDPGLLLRRYERQIKELKAELAMRDTLRCGRKEGRKEGRKGGGG
jgi:hypothetical protein